MRWQFIFGLIIFKLCLLIRANIVNTTQGALIGTTMKSSSGRTFSAYYGIPYAQPPIGDLRFKPPVEALPWQGLLNASSTPTPCLQCKPATNITFGEEDCLTLNVYTPLNAKPGDNFPVIVYIFGGIFKQGSSNHNGVQFFMNKDVIFVMPNYRLGALGFLSTGDNVISGNMGLKDQTLAMKWTKNNIFAFGGDTNRITIQGHSSGSICAHLHTISPMSKGLFNRVIMQSGTSFGTVGFFDKEVSRYITRELAARVGCNILSSKELLNCFMRIKGETFLAAQYEMSISDWNPDALFRPTIEDETAKDAFITQVPTKSLYQSTDQEWLIGMTSGEGVYYTSDELLDDEITEEINSNYKTIFPMTLQYLWNTRPKDRDFISVMLRKRYFNNQKIDFKLSAEYTRMYTQGLYGSNVNEAFRRYKGTKYVYLYDYMSGFSIHNQHSQYGTILGIGHADEIPLIFYDPEKTKYNFPQDFIFGHEVITRLINFAYSGNPNVPYPINESLFSSWNPVTSDHIEYLHLLRNGKMETDYYNSEYKFWRSLPIFSKFF